MPAIFKQAALWPHSSSFFSEVVKFVRRDLMGRTVGLSKTVIFDFTTGEVHMLQLQSGTLKCPVDVTYLTALALCKQISNISTGKKLGQMKWNVMMEKLLL